LTARKYYRIKKGNYKLQRIELPEILELKNIDNRYFDDKKPIIVIGFFDGVHLGHRRIIETCVDRARKIKGSSIVLTFNQPPINVIKNKMYKKLIIPFREKIKIIGDLGVDYIVTADFSPDFLKLKPEKFCRYILIKKLHITEILVGKGFRFGFNAEGDVRFLKRFFRPLNVIVDSVPLLKIRGEIASSTNIRKYYSLGDIKKIRNLLGRDPQVEGTVIKGAGRGRKLGFPTANINISRIFITPKDGVYLGKVKTGSIEDKLFPAVINIGDNPTFKDAKRWVETFIINFEKDLYGKKIKIIFLERLRDEIGFKDGDKLIKQMKIDLQYAYKYFNINRC
jgi:riboflavin kinase/FMN adenylyltransferase